LDEHGNRKFPSGEITQQGSPAIVKLGRGENQRLGLTAGFIRTGSHHRVGGAFEGMGADCG
jgi:hypothetical protein